MYDPDSSFLGVYPWEIEAGICRRICRQVF